MSPPLVSRDQELQSLVRNVTRRLKARHGEMLEVANEFASDNQLLRESKIRELASSLQFVVEELQKIAKLSTIEADVSMLPGSKRAMVLEMSTKHVSEEATACLSEPPDSLWTCEFKTGWFVKVPEFMDDIDKEEELTQALGNKGTSIINVLVFAKKWSCQWLVLEHMARIYKELPVYDW